MNQLKVVFCTDGVFPHQIGGMQRHSRLLVEELAKEDIDIHVIHPHKDTQVYDSALGITEHYVEGISTEKNYLKESKRYSKRVHKVVAALPKDTIVYNQGFAIWANAADFSDRLITNPHGLEPFQAMSKKDKLIAIPFKRVFSTIFTKSLYTVSLGGHLTRILRQIVPKERIVNLPNAVALPDDSELKPKPDLNEPIKLFFVARFASNKGIHILMQAIKELNAIGYADKLEFNLGGKGPLYEQYKEECKEPNVNLLGFVSDEDLKRLYAESDVFVFPTLFEGMPTVVLEAMSNYLPIIVSDTGATKELVHSDNGYVIEPGDVEGLKDAIVSYYQLSAEDKNRMSQTSYDRFSGKFTWGRVAEKHMELFREIQSKMKQA